MCSKPVNFLVNQVSLMNITKLNLRSRFGKFLKTFVIKTRKCLSAFDMTIK